MAAFLRRLVFGRPIASELEHEHRLRKILALPIFSSDALSSVAYALITVANLRGVKESGAIFAIPTYSFIAVTLAMVAWGTVKMLGGGLAPNAEPEVLSAHSAVGMFLLLKAFSSGCAALTGVE